MQANGKTNASEPKKSTQLVTSRAISISHLEQHLISRQKSNPWSNPNGSLKSLNSLKKTSRPKLQTLQSYIVLRKHGQHNKDTHKRRTKKSMKRMKSIFPIGENHINEWESVTQMLRDEGTNRTDKPRCRRARHHQNFFTNEEESDKKIENSRKGSSVTIDEAINHKLDEKLIQQVKEKSSSVKKRTQHLCPGDEKTNQVNKKRTESEKAIPPGEYKETKLNKQGIKPYDDEGDRKLDQKRRQISSDSEEDEDDDDGLDDDDDDQNKDFDEDEDSDDDRENEVPEKSSADDIKTRHIHPCICDLHPNQKARIHHHVKKSNVMETKHRKRLQQIQSEYDRLEEERIAKEREIAEQEELFRDEYEVVGKKKKRKKRSARRASMVSLGIKQVINFRKSPKIKPKYNKTSGLRKQYHSYCGIHELLQPSKFFIDISRPVKIPTKFTKSYSLRSEVNIKKKAELILKEDRKPLFVVPSYF